MNGTLGDDDEVIFTNDVLYFLHDAEERVSYKVYAEQCEGKFSEKAIYDAKMYALEKAKDIRDHGCQKNITKKRQDSTNRSAAAAHIRDLVEILRALDGETRGKL